jgi:hypothetical protein
MSALVSPASALDVYANHALKTINRLKRTWTKLTKEDIACYKKGSRSTFLTILQRKYSFTLEEAESSLSTLERLAAND